MYFYFSNIIITFVMLISKIIIKIYNLLLALDNSVPALNGFGNKPLFDGAIIFIL